MVDINNEKASINHDQLQLPGQMNLSSQSVSIFFSPLYFFQFRTMVIESSLSCKYHNRWSPTLRMECTGAQLEQGLYEVFWRQRWFGHVQRRDSDYISGTMLLFLTNGQEAWRKCREEIYGRSERGHEGSSQKGKKTRR